MKTGEILITSVLFAAVCIVPSTSFAQNLGDGTDKLWISACPVGTSTDCNQSWLFHDAIAVPFSQSDSVAIGTVIQKESIKDKSIVYSINVDFYLKNYQPFDLLTITLNDVPPEMQAYADVWYYNSPIFNEGDLVFVYLVKNDGSYELLPESFALDKQENRGPPPNIHLTENPSENTFLQGEKILVSGDVRKMELVEAAKKGERMDVELTLHRPYDESDVIFSNLIDIDTDGYYNYQLDTSNISPGEYHLKVKYGPSSSSTDMTIAFNSKYWSPLKQFKLGITIDEIQCRETLALITKYDGSPACVTPDTKEKLAERNWLYQKKSTLLILDNNQQDIGIYLKQVSILDESSITATVSYPTNTAHHEMFPDGYQSIVSDCTEKKNGANLSLLYLEEIDNEQNKMTFKIEDSEFPGLQCDDALWEELTRWGYCGPPNYVIPHIDVLMPSVADAQRQVGFVFDVPKYLPKGYDIQKVTVGWDNDRTALYISPKSITDETQSCEFAWDHEGIYLFYGVHPEILNFGSSYSDTPGKPQTWPVTINGNSGLAEQRWVGDRFGTPIPQLSTLRVSMPDDGILISMRSSLPVEELIKVAESISNPIFNSDIIPDYTSSYNMPMQNSNDSISVQIIGDTAFQICDTIRMTCDDDHTFYAEYDFSTHTATFEQSVSFNKYVLEIMPGEICYKINGDQKKYCSTLHIPYSPIVDGNKSTILFKPLDYWKNISMEELYKFDEEYGEVFYKELGKMMLKHEIKNELKKHNIENMHDDFLLHVAGADESSQVFYKSVLNGTDEKSYMFDGGAYYNQVRGLSFEELIFHDNVLDELSLDLLFDDQPIIISPKDDENYNPHDTITVNLDDGNDLIFYNGMSVPVKISVYDNENTKDQTGPEWVHPILNPAQTMTFSLEGTGLYKWDARLEPESSSEKWWPRYAGGTIAAYSNQTQSLELEKKLRIAQVFIQNSEIPYSGLSTKNEMLEIGFNSAINEMLPDFQKYYTARAYQLIPFDVPIIIEEPVWND